jgi:hypothetical protein
MRRIFVRTVAIMGVCAGLCGPAGMSQTPSQMPNGGDVSSGHEPTKVPAGVILVKGAWSSASDSVTPVPEGGSMNNNVYSNPYFGLRYVLSSDWQQSYTGPPPSDSGRYVLGQIRPAQGSEQSARGSILITAQDLFFPLIPAHSARELMQYTSDNLEPYYKVELPPTPVQIGNRSFVRFDYGSPAAGLHWHILVTEIRCHAVEFVFTSRDTKLAESLVQSMSTVDWSKVPDETGGGEVPVCIKDYASDENILEREDPVLTERKFNSIPVRVIIDKQGRVKHIHFLSAFPEQAKTISDSLMQWRFRPYLRDGQPVEVETGILFGRTPRRVKGSANSGVTE